MSSQMTVALSLLQGRAATCLQAGEGQPEHVLAPRPMPAQGSPPPVQCLRAWPAWVLLGLQVRRYYSCRRNSHARCPLQVTFGDLPGHRRYKSKHICEPERKPRQGSQVFSERITNLTWASSQRKVFCIGTGPAGTSYLFVGRFDHQLDDQINQQTDMMSLQAPCRYKTLFFG